MAIMIPDKPRDFKKNSLEDIMFDALKSLPDDFYVIHSYKYVYVNENIMYEGETDFLVFSPNHGVLCLEAKAGQVNYTGGRWCYGDGTEMKNGGPYNQADNNKWNLMNTIKMSPLKELLKRCKFLHAVWFPSIRKKDLYTNRFPADFARDITMTMEDLDNPTKAILDIFAIELPSKRETDLSEADAKRLLREVLCPEFKIFPSRNFDVDLKKVTFHRLLKEQYGLLNYLEEQRTAVINGAAGTGKTMIAVEKATRHANDGDKVLFLCYNAYLRDHLEETHAHNNIDFLTIASFACKMCGTKEPDYKKAKDVIEEMYLLGTFPYVHVIVDEGQDFGSDKIEESDILQVIHDTVVDNERGTFYVFYDKLQLIQSENIPQYISDADCKLTLYKNCRNTENIATTSLKPVADRNPKLMEGAIKGVPAKMYYRKDEDSEVQKIKEIIETLEREGITDIVILTCKTEDKSVLTGKLTDKKFCKKRFTTCRKFKGLEADAVILIDIDAETFEGKNVLRFYVGASRARLRLELVTRMDDEACSYFLSDIIHYTKKIKNPKKDLSVALNAFPEIE